MAREMRKPKWVWFNDQLVPFDDAKIHMLSPCARYGINVFEALRAYWNEEGKKLYLFRLREHYERLAESMKLMWLQNRKSINDNIQIVLETVRRNDFQEDCRIIHTVYVDGFGGSSATEPVGLFICPLPVGRMGDVEKGISCMISSWSRIGDNSMPARIKAGSNYQNGRLGALWARKDGYDEPIFLNAEGKVTEGAASCFFMIRKGVVVTPPITAGILESITRETLLHLIREELRFPVEVRDIDRTETYLAEEAFLCGTAYEVTPINSVDRLPLGEGKPGPMTRKIQEIYFDVARGRTSKYSDWRVGVY
jgi:branched-chain amino acid aminotransferase